HGNRYVVAILNSMWRRRRHVCTHTRFEVEYMSTGGKFIAISNELAASTGVKEFKRGFADDFPVQGLPDQGLLFAGYLQDKIVFMIHMIWRHGARRRNENPPRPEAHARVPSLNERAHGFQHFANELAIFGVLLHMQQREPGMRRFNRAHD